MKRLSPNNCSVVVFQNGENELASTLQLLYKVFSDGKKKIIHTHKILLVKILIFILSISQCKVNRKSSYITTKTI